MKGATVTHPSELRWHEAPLPPTRPNLVLLVMIQFARGYRDDFLIAQAYEDLGEWWCLGEKGGVQVARYRRVTDVGTPRFYAVMRDGGLFPVVADQSGAEQDGATTAGRA